MRICLSISFCSAVAISMLGACAATPDDVSFDDLFEEEGGQGKADAYGSEKRVELYEAGENVRILARSIAAVVHDTQIEPISATHVRIGRFEPHLDSLADVSDDMGKPLCANEPFRDQPSRARGTAFLVAPDIVATAGHVASRALCPDLRFVFDFAYHEDPSTRPDGDRGVLVQPASNVYSCIEKRYAPGDTDLALIRLDRPVSGRYTLPLVDDTVLPAPGTPVAMLGYPTGLPAKFAPPGRVIHKDLPVEFPGGSLVDNPDEGFFTNLGAFKGNSGSPVLSARGIEGVLVQGDSDFEWDDEQRCYVTHLCADDGSDCSGEYVLRAAHLIEMMR